MAAARTWSTVSRSQSGPGVQEIQVSTPSGPVAVVLEDVDHDGMADFITSTSGGQMSVALSVGSGTFGVPNMASCGSNTRGLAVADYNEDCVADVATVSTAGELCLMMSQ